jgi:hypothetical protein
MSTSRLMKPREQWTFDSMSSRLYGGYEEEEQEIALAAKSLLISRAERTESKLGKRTPISIPPRQKYRTTKA